MIRNILVPVDLSESSLNALDTAVAIAKKHKASIQILHIEENILNHADEAVPTFLNTISNSSDILAALASTIYYTHNIRPKIVFEEGNVSDTIIEKSQQLHADLIIMGAHGASGYRDGYIGTNTYNVIKNAMCPVLSIPVKKKILSFQNVLFPIRPVSGGLMHYNIVRYFTNPNTIMDILGLSYRMVEADTGILNTIVEEIRKLLEKDRVQTKVSWGEGGTIADDILRFAMQRKPDLIIVTSAIDGTSKPRFIGPYTQKIIHCAKVPVLSIKKVTIPTFV